MGGGMDPGDLFSQLFGGGGGGFFGGGGMFLSSRARIYGSGFGLWPDGMIAGR